MVDHIHGEIFVLQPSTVVVYPLNADGDVAPVRQLIGPTTLLHHPSGLALDVVHDELIVVDAVTGDILAFPRNASGDVPPLRRISTPPNSRNYLRESKDLAFDTATASLVVSNGPGLEIAEFLTIGGDTAPRAVQNLPRGWISLDSFAVDADHLYIAASRVTGSYEMVCPRRSANPDNLIGGDCVGDRTHDPPLIRILPSANNVMVLSSDRVNTFGQNWSFLRTLTGLQASRDIAIDEEHYELLVLDSRGVLAFPLAAEGAATPLRQLQVPADAHRLMVDEKRDRIDVLTLTGIFSYARTASGAASPLGLLRGPRSGLQQAVAFVLCSTL